MAERKRISLFLTDNPTVKKYVKIESFEALINDVVRKFELQCKPTELKIFSIDGTEVDADVYDDVIDTLNCLVASKSNSQAEMSPIIVNVNNDAPYVGSELSVDDNQDPNQRFPKYYKLPEFSSSVQKVLDQKKQGAKMIEHVTNSIVTCIKDDLLKYLGSSPYLTSRQYTVVCESLIQKYPFLADSSESGTGISLWKKKLIRKFKVYRKNCPNLSESLLIARKKFGGTKKTARPAPDSLLASSSPRKKILLEKCSNQIKMNVDETLEEMKSEMAKVRPNEDILTVLLLKTRPERQRRAQTTNLVQEHQFWPVYKYKNVVYREYLNGLNSPAPYFKLESIIENLLERFSETLPIRLARNLKFRAIPKKFGTDKYVNAFAALPLCFREDTVHFIDVINSNKDMMDVSRQLITVKIDGKFAVMLDRSILYSELDNLASAIALQISCHYLLDIVYACPHSFSIFEYALGIKACFSERVKSLVNKLEIKQFA